MSIEPSPVRNTVLLAGSMTLTVTLLRIVLHASPDVDLNVGRYNLHHLFLGLVLVTAGGVPLAVLRGTGRAADLALIVFGAGLGMALDEWVYLIATDGSNASYVLPISFVGSVLVVGLALAYTIAFALVRRLRERGQDTDRGAGERR